MAARDRAKSKGKGAAERSGDEASRQPAKRPWRELLEALLIAALFLRFANTFVLQTFYIPSGSMEETLLVGDHLFVNRFVYGATATGMERSLLPHRGVERGDVVIFRSPEDPTIDIVKRCIALPGDTVQVRSKQLYVNGERVEDDEYTVHKAPGVEPVPPARAGLPRSRDHFGPYTVPPDHYFCMGDNRDYSYDSRFWGPVPRSLVKGRAFMIYWSYDYGGDPPGAKGRGPFETLARFGRTLVGLPANTRWSRTFHVIR